MTYKELNALPAETFLSPEKFRTDFDAQHASGAYPAQQYAKGLDIGRAALKVGVGVSGTWWAEMRDGGHMSSSEGIGYHACTADLWRGLLDSGAEVWVYRYNSPSHDLSSKRIK